MARSTRSCSAFGTDLVAEVTGRSRRIVRKRGGDGVDRLVVENRAGLGANLGETQAFMDDAKRILVFSDAGGTGRSYHADLAARNRRLRVHYLLEAGWKADAAIQGLGRTAPIRHSRHCSGRLYQCEGRKALPLDHRAAARHARRHHQGTAPDRRAGPASSRRQSRKVITRAMRCASSTSWWSPERSGLLSLGAFEDATGLKLTDSNGIRDELPPITARSSTGC